MQDIIDIKNLYGTIRKTKVMIVLIISLTVASMAVYLWLIAKPVYQSDTQVLINQMEKTNNLQEQDVQANLKLIETYSAIITSPRILNQVEKELKYKYSKSALSGALQVKSSVNSQLLTITAQYGSAQAASEIANKTAKVFKEETPKIMKVDNVTVLSHASLPKQPIKPNKSLMLIFSFLLGVILAFIFVLFKTISDRTIKTEDDLRISLNLNVLGIINDFQQQEKQLKKYGGKE